MNRAGGGPGLVEARVIAAFGRRCLLEHDDGQTGEAVRRGKRGDAVVGDRVRCVRGAGEAVIESIAPRASLLFRADAMRVKPLAANVDQVAVVFAAQPALNREFVWRALLAARAAGVDAIALLNKTDLAIAGAEAVAGQLGALGARVARVSARQAPELARSTLHALFDRRATLLVGQSGMGKSTILNLLIGADTRTGELSRHGTHGRQTTTSSRWYHYGEHGAIVDTPGFQEFGLAHLSAAELARLMPEFDPLLGNCRFADCRHLDEPACAVRAALAAGAVAAERYAFYRGLAVR